MPRVEFVGHGWVDATSGQTLLDVCDSYALPMETACGGFAACNSCRVRLVSGVLSALDESEAPFLDRADQRLGCQARVVGDCVVAFDPG